MENIKKFCSNYYPINNLFLTVVILNELSMTFQEVSPKKQISRGLFQIPRFFTNLENSLSYSIGKVRALKFTIYIILITHISGCVWFLDACYGKE